jgi:hypothetical protein
MEAAFTKFRTIIAILAILAMIVVAAAMSQTVVPASGEAVQMIIACPPNC